MSSLVSSVTIDLHEGFSWVALLKVQPSPQSGLNPQLIWSLATADDPLAASLMIEPGGGLSCQFGGQSVILSAAQSGPFHDQWAMYACYAEYDAGKLKLQLEINNDVKAEAAASYAGPRLFATMTLGGGASFELAETFTAGQVLADADRAGALGYLKDKFKF